MPVCGRSERQTTSNVKPRPGETKTILNCLLFARMEEIRTRTRRKKALRKSGSLISDATVVSRKKS